LRDKAEKDKDSVFVGWKPRSGQRGFHIYGTHAILAHMKTESVRTTVDIPASLYRKLKSQAAAQGRSTRDLILAGIRKALMESRRSSPKRVQFPLIVSEGPKVNVTNNDIYEHVEFP
jgi:hypothetical protein